MCGANTTMLLRSSNNFTSPIMRTWITDGLVVDAVVHVHHSWDVQRHVLQKGQDLQRQQEPTWRCNENTSRLDGDGGAESTC